MKSMNHMQVVILSIVVGLTNAAGLVKNLDQKLKQQLRRNDHASVNRVKTMSSALVSDADWFHAHSRGGKWSVGSFDSTGIVGGSIPSWTQLRYNFIDAPCTDAIPDKKKIISDISYIDFTIIKEAVVLDVKVKGWVSEQYYNHTTKTVDNIDEMNIFLDGNWIYQASAGKNANAKCQMNGFVVTHSLEHDDGWGDNILVLTPGSRSISIEIKTSTASFHNGAYYEVEFAMTPVSKMATDK